MAKSKRGFASAKQRPKAKERGQKGGKQAAAKKTAHRFTKDEAKAAGSKGGKAKETRRQLKKQVDRLANPEPEHTGGEAGDLTDGDGDGTERD